MFLLFFYCVPFFSYRLISWTKHFAFLLASRVPFPNSAQLLLSNIDRAFEERTTLESDMQDLLLEQETLNEQFIASAAHQRTLEDELRDLRISQETVQRALIQTCIRSAENLTTRAVAENDVAAANGTSSYFRMIAEDLQSVLNELVLVNAAYTNDPDNNGEGMVRKIVLAGHLLASVHAQGMSVGNTASDIEIGERESLNTFCRSYK